jgi:hypothetical protein
MEQMSISYNKTFPPKDETEEAQNDEGVENCVCKNLFSEIFLPPDESQEHNQNRLIA